MRILIDCRFWGPKHTGLGRYTENLLRNLLKIDKKNQYILLFQKETIRNNLTMKQCNNVTIFQINAPPYSLREQFELPLALRKINPDLVHFPHFNTPIFSTFPFVITIHDLIKHYSKGVKTTTRTPWIYLFKYLGYRTVIRQSILKAKKIIVPSKWVKKELLKHFPITEEKVVVVYEAAVKTPPRWHGVTPRRWRSKEELLEKYKIRRPFILYVGNAYPHKNLRRLILATKMINQSPITNHQSPINLVIVCARDVFWQRLRDEVRKLGAEKFVIMPGFVSDKDLQILYFRAKAYVSSSLMEGFGLPGIEAMMSNCPVVCSNIPTFKEIYKSAAVYFNPEDVDDMKEKILKVVSFSKKERQNIIKEGEIQAKRYSWKKCAQQTLQIYQCA